MRTKYNSRVWLNPTESDSTGSVVSYDGTVTDLDSKEEIIFRYLEIADCRTKVRLHQTSDDTKEMFINKLRTLRGELDLFIDHLENSKDK